ncbi:MAG: RNA polymerase sigma-70 factor [Bacteroidota bacterium]
MSPIETWFRTYYASLTAFAWKLVGSQAVAEELVQQLFVSLYEKGDQLTVPTTPKAYLFQAVRNRCLNHLKQAQRKQAQETSLETIHDQGSRYDDPLEATEFEAQLYRWIQALPPACQQVFRLSRFEAKSNAEIAELLGISKRTVETHISKALKLLRAKLAASTPAGSASLLLLWVLGLAMLGGAACQKPILYTGPEITPRLVVESHFQPDSTWHLFLSKSQSINDSVSVRRVLDARVLLKGPAWEEEMVLSGLQYVTPSRRPVEGAAYELSVFADGLGSVFAKDTVPYAPDIEVLDTLTTAVSGQRAIVVELELTPHPLTRYHLIEAYQVLQYEGDSTVAFPVTLIDLDEKIANEGLGNNGGMFSQLYVPGTDWEGETQLLRFAIDRIFFPSDPQDPNPPRFFIQLDVSGVSQARYLYQRQMRQYNISNGLGILPQALDIPSNIQQGLGIFGAYSGTQTLIELE